jgi:hypothetical protein
MNNINWYVAFIVLSVGMLYPLHGAVPDHWLIVITPVKWREVFLGAFEKLRKATISFAMPASPSVRPSAWNTLAPTRRIFMIFDIWEFF